MSVSLRLSRGGSKKRPYYKVVVANSRAPRDGKYLEQVGTYNPLLAKDDANRVRLIEDRIAYWLGVGAQPTDRVARMLDKAGIKERAPTLNPKKGEPGQKAKDRVEDKAAKAAEAEEAAKEAAAAPAVEEVVEEASAEAPAAEEAAAEAPAAEEAAAEEAPAAEAQAEEVAAEEAPAEEAQAEQAQAEEAAAEEAPAEETAAEEAPAAEASEEQTEG